MNDLTIKTVRKLKDTTGQYLRQPVLTKGAPDTILGRSVHTSTFVTEVKAGAKMVVLSNTRLLIVSVR